MLPTLSRLSVNNRPDGRLRHRCSSRYLRISPLHREFRHPLRHSSDTVSSALPRLSRGISHPTYIAAYTRFTPSNSEQRLHPLYYRGCWHRVSRCFLWRYRQRRVLTGSFVPPDRALQPEGLHHSRGIAGSGFRPLSNIPTAASRRSLGRVSVPVWLIILSDQLPVVALVSHYLTN